MTTLEKKIEAVCVAMLSDFNSEYGYVTIDMNIVKRFVRKFKCTNIHLLYDWCVSQNIHHGVQE